MILLCAFNFYHITMPWSAACQAVVAGGYDEEAEYRIIDMAALLNRVEYFEVGFSSLNAGFFYERFYMTHNRNNKKITKGSM